MAYYKRIKVGRRNIVLWNNVIPLIDLGEQGIKGLNVDFIADTKKYFAKKKKEITRAEKRNLDYLGNYTPKLLRQMVSYKFNKFLDSIDRTEVAKKSNKKIY